MMPALEKKLAPTATVRLPNHSQESHLNDATGMNPTRLDGQDIGLHHRRMADKLRRDQQDMIDVCGRARIIDGNTGQFAHNHPYYYPMPGLISKGTRETSQSWRINPIP